MMRTDCCSPRDGPRNASFSCLQAKNPIWYQLFLQNCSTFHRNGGHSHTEFYFSTAMHCTYYYPLKEGSCWKTQEDHPFGEMTEEGVSGKGPPIMCRELAYFYTVLIHPRVGPTCTCLPRAKPCTWNLIKQFTNSEEMYYVLRKRGADCLLRYKNQ